MVQVGTQLRSLPSFTGCRELYKTGILGKVGRIEQCRNNEKPYWYSYVKEVKPEDVDWKEFLGDLPSQPFDPVKYSGWYGYREFSDGPVCGYGSHYLDLVHYITGAKFPTSSVCLGGTYTYNDEHHFTCPDHVQAMWTYPEGFMVSYSTYCGNGSRQQFQDPGRRGRPRHGHLDRSRSERRGRRQALRQDPRQEPGEGRADAGPLPQLAPVPAVPPDAECLD